MQHYENGEYIVMMYHHCELCHQSIVLPAGGIIMDDTLRLERTPEAEMWSRTHVSPVILGFHLISV